MAILIHFETDLAHKARETLGNDVREYPNPHGQEATGRQDAGSTESPCSGQKDPRAGPVSIQWFRKLEQDEGTAGNSYYADDEILGSTTLGNGLVRLYRDAVTDEDEGDQPSTLVSILSVPGYMTASDLLGFVSERNIPRISHVRMIRANYPNRYMVLLKFRELHEAVEFREQYNGRTFSSLEPEKCHVVFISGISFEEKGTCGSPVRGDAQFPSKLSSRAEPPPTRALQELPTCVVCLERMDACVTGLVTIVCQHTFHCECLKKWSDNSCPVCRYSHENALSKRNVSANTSKCAQCSTTQNLWICLICGNIACGRYTQAHAYAHYQETDHVFSLDLESQRVWDYAGDEYVHRLIQNKADGKLVELPSGHGPAHAMSSVDTKNNDKLDNMGLEYTYLLTQQLDSQRMYYEDQLNALSSKLSKIQARSGPNERDFGRLEREKKSLEQAISDHQTLLSKEQNRNRELEKKVSTLSTLARTLNTQLAEEKSITDNLMAKIEALSQHQQEHVQRCNKKDEKIKDLEEQLRDVMLSLSLQDKIAAAGPELQDEIAGGSLSLGPTSHQNSKSERRTTKR